MDQNTPGDLFGLEVDHESGTYFKEAGRWGNFIAIIYFVCTGLLILGVLIVGAVASGNPSLFGERVDGSGSITITEASALARAFAFIIVIGFLVLLVYGGIMLYRFASRCREGIDRQDQLTFNMGLKALRNYFVCTAIFGGLSILNYLVTIIGI